jgi:hypothetical protein
MRFHLVTIRLKKEFADAVFCEWSDFGFFDFGVSLLRRLLLGAPESLKKKKPFYRV